MRAHFTTALILSLIAGSAVRAGWCEDAQALGTQGGDISLVFPGTDNVAQCTRSLVLSDGSQVHCGWVYSYRAPAAQAAFDQLMNTVTGCLGTAARIASDQDVNHPDFYDLQTFQLNGLEIGVSLKDKAAPSETYVFLRVAVSE